MKVVLKYLFFALLIGLDIGCDSESTVKPRDSDFFVKLYGSSGNQFGEEVKSLIDGFIIVGSSDFSGVNSDIFVVRTDLQGNELWSKTFGRNANDKGSAVAEMGTGFVVVGNSENDQGNMDMLVIIIDSDGQELNRTIVGDPSFNDEAADVIITQTGNILIAGASSNTSVLSGRAGGSYDFYFPQLQPDLVPVPNWIGYYGFSGKDKAEAVEQKENGDFIFLGTTDKNEPNNSAKAQSNMIIFQVTEQGLPNTSDVTFGTLQKEAASNVATTSDGGFLLIGSTTSTDNISKVFISRIRQNNSVLGNYTINTSRENTSSNVIGKSICQSQEGGYIVIGDITTLTGTNIYMTRTTNDGAILWERTFGNSGENTAGGILELEDGSFVFTGSINLDNQSKVCLIKTNSSGDLSSL